MLLTFAQIAFDLGPG